MTKFVLLVAALAELSLVLTLVLMSPSAYAKSKSIAQTKSSAKGKSDVIRPESKKVVRDLWLEWNSSVPIKHWLFEKGARYDGPLKLAALAQVKKFELEEKFEDCTAQILKVWPRHLQFHGWMALQGTQCLVNQLKFAKPVKLNLYPQWWRHLEKNGGGILWGPWTSDLLKSWSELSQFIVKSGVLNAVFRAEVAESWRQLSESLSKNDRQELFKVIAEALVVEGDVDGSQALVLREGLSKTTDNGSSAPASSSLATSGQSTTNGATTYNLGGSSVNGNGPGGAAPKSQSWSEEDEIYAQFLEQLKLNQLVGAAELAVSLSDKYPNGNKSPSVQEKLQQAYFNKWESQGSTEQKLQIDRSIEVIKLMHSSRLIDWARLAHRKADFKGAYIFAKQALVNEEKSVDGAPLLFIIGRSAYFMGLYREAIQFFDRLNERHFGYSEIWEVRFRKAQALIRLGEDSKAEEALADLWAAPDNKSYALSSLYWLIRLRQKRKATVEDLVKSMQERFSLTYYGLKLSAEANSKKVNLGAEPSPIVVRQKWTLTPMELSQWERAKALAAAGWYAAAQGELNNFLLSGNAEQKFLWSQLMVKFFAFPQALRQMNELSDLEPRWNKSTYLKTVFPKPLEHLVQAESQKNELNPLLIYSLIRQESAFLLGATSRSQAKGLMQLIPATANEVAGDFHIKNFDSDQMYHPVTNLKFGIYYLAKVIRQFGGNVSIGLAAYNAGPQRLKKFFEARTEVENPALLSQEDPWSDFWIEELPWLETNLYVKSILRNRVIYQILEQGSFELPSPVWKDLYLGTKKVSQAGRVTSPSAKGLGQKFKR
jgi:soluble lytic murein transglycosylase